MEISNLPGSVCCLASSHTENVIAVGLSTGKIIVMNMGLNDEIKNQKPYSGNFADVALEFAEN